MKLIYEQNPFDVTIIFNGSYSIARNILLL